MISFPRPPDPLAPIAPELLTCRQAAQLCGLSERTLARLSQAGAMPRPVKGAGGVDEKAADFAGQGAAWCTE